MTTEDKDKQPPAPFDPYAILEAQSTHRRVAAPAPEPIDSPKRPPRECANQTNLSPEQQSSLDTTLRTGVEQKDNNLIELALRNGADPNILMFAGIAYKPSLVKNLTDPEDLYAIHAEEMYALANRQQRRRMGLLGRLKDFWNSDESMTARYRQEIRQLNASQEKKREDYNRGFEWLQLAVKVGANVNATNPAEVDEERRPYPAIHCAYSHFRKDISDFLIARGASVDTPSPQNNTPLMRSVYDGHTVRVRYYLSKGADPMRLCIENSFPLKELQVSDEFTREQKAELLTLMMQHIKPTPPVPSEASQTASELAGNFNAASNDIGLPHEIKVNKPLSVKPPPTPARGFKL